MTNMMNKISSNIQFYLYLLGHIEENPKERVPEVNKMLQKLRDSYGIETEDLVSVLDLGCGRLMHTSRILRNYGKKVYALDREYVYESAGLSNWTNSLRYNGLRSFARDFLLDVQGRRKRMQNAIDGLTGGSSSASIETVRNEVENMADVQTSSIDLCISTYLLEHVRNLEMAFAEIRRVLKPGGFTINIIHLFGSLSGDHNMNYQDFNRFPPWAHLRNKTRYRFPWGHLNGFTSAQYVDAFMHYFPSGKYEWGEEDELSRLASSLLSERVLEEIQTTSPHIPREDLLHHKFWLHGKSSY
jgi:SAM-dependent methyltransferase